MRLSPASGNASYRTHPWSSPAAQRIRSRLLLLTVAACLVHGAVRAAAQTGSGGGKTVDSKRKARLMDRYREKLDVRDDAEWDIIRERLDNVLRADRDLQAAVSNSGAKSSSKDTTVAGHSKASGSSDAGSERDVRALRKLVETKASPREIKAQLAKVREMLRDKQGKLAEAQEALRDVLSARQEAVAVLNGLLR